MLNIIVCVKQVLDPEAPTSAYEIDSESKRVKVRGVQPVQNPYDENALEAALRIKDKTESKVTAISLGRNLAKPVLMKSLAAGADALVFLQDNIFEDMDSHAAALVLAAAIRKLGTFDIIFTGRQAADSNAGVVGSGIAELLGIPSVTVVRKVELLDGKLRAEQVTPDGYQVIESSLPALVTISHELGELRKIGVKDLMAAQKKPLTILNARDLGFDTSPGRQSELLRLYRPTKEGKCEIVAAETPEEAGANLALRLRQSKVL